MTKRKRIGCRKWKRVRGRRVCVSRPVRKPRRSKARLRAPNGPLSRYNGLFAKLRAAGRKRR